MNNERKAKYSNKYGKSIVKNDLKIDIKFDLPTLNLFCAYVVSENRNINRGHIINMRNLIALLDKEKYNNDTECLKRLDFIERAMDARLNHNLTNPFMIIKHINGGLLDSDIIDVQSFTSMSNDELKWVNETVSETLKYSYIYNDIDAFYDAITEFKTSDYRNKGEAVRRFETLINNSQVKFRKSRSESMTEAAFSLKGERFENSIRDIHNQLSNPANKLRCGMQGLNEMLSGGFESGRVTCFFGLPGEGKSTTLLNLAYQIKRYNKDYKPKDPTKIPCIVFLTMENTVRETVERLFTISTASDNTLLDYSADQAIELFRTSGDLRLSEDNPIDIYIKYVPGMSVDTSYLYTLVEDLEDEGYECICVIQDYLKRIRSSTNNSGDIRLELGAVVNEFKVFATLKDIPVITASQLNRDATKNIDEGRKTNKADLVRILGRSNIGESMLMLENLDAGFLIAPEYDSAGNKYLGIQRIKARFRATNREHIYQPYVPENDIRFIEDEFCALPVYRDTMRPDLNEVANKFDNGLKPNSYHSNSVKDISNIKLQTSEDNIYVNISAKSVRQDNIDDLTRMIMDNRKMINPIQYVS